MILEPLYLFVRRDFLATYKQTVLGPLWHLIQPLPTARADRPGRPACR